MRLRDAFEIRCEGSKRHSLNDTPPDIEQRYRAMLMRRTGAERLIMGCAMRDTARAFVEASLREQDPNATEVTIRKGVFLRFYGHEFDARPRAKILAAIEHASHSSAPHANAEAICDGVQ